MELLNNSKSRRPEPFGGGLFHVLRDSAMHATWSSKALVRWESWMFESVLTDTYDLLGLAIDGNMKFSPSSSPGFTVGPTVPLAFAIHFQPCGVDDDMADIRDTPDILVHSSERQERSARCHWPCSLTLS
jgi:hypothetical protein